jgi:hypothetical protein
MRLITLHKILIGSFSAFSIFFGIRELVRTDMESNSLIAVSSLLLALLGIGYFIWVARGGYDRRNRT